MYIIFFVVGVLASLIGAVCGVGGGIIIKPVMDALGHLNAAEASFLSGCSVLSMSLYSVIKSKAGKQSKIHVKTSSALAVGSVLGGIGGKLIFQNLWALFPNKSTVGLIQAVCLTSITAFALLYCLYKRNIRTHHMENFFAAVLLGLLLGFLSSFLGIGGGPVNLVALYFFFSMGTKEAAENSLYIILFSQVSSLLLTVASDSVPNMGLLLPMLMILGGISGSFLGARLNKKIRSETVHCLFVCLMSLIILINLYNILRFSGAYR